MLRDVARCCEVSVKRSNVKYETTMLTLNRWEARRCPNVVVSAIDPRKYDNRQTQFAALPPPCPPAPAGMAPLPGWETKFLSQFSDLRTVLYLKER